MFAEFVEGGTTINSRSNGLGFSEAPSTLVGADGKSIAQILSGTPFRDNSGPLEAGHFLAVPAESALVVAPGSGGQMENKLALDARRSGAGRSREKRGYLD